GPARANATSTVMHTRIDPASVRPGAAVRHQGTRLARYDAAGSAATARASARMIRSTFVRGGSQAPSACGGTLPVRRYHHALSRAIVGRLRPIATAAYSATLSAAMM